MNVLLAPNGKPSNLTPEQYKLVRSSEFKAWFGDWENSPETSSKVIDEETKEPLVVYHGSKVIFNKFEITDNYNTRQYGNKLFWFSKNKETAKSPLYVNYDNYSKEYLEIKELIINLFIESIQNLKSISNLSEVELFKKISDFYDYYDDNLSFNENIILIVSELENQKADVGGQEFSNDYIRLKNLLSIIYSFNKLENDIIIRYINNKKDIDNKKINNPLNILSINDSLIFNKIQEHINLLEDKTKTRYEVESKVLDSLFQNNFIERRNDIENKFKNFPISSSSKIYEVFLNVKHLYKMEIEEYYLNVNHYEDKYYLQDEFNRTIGETEYNDYDGGVIYDIYDGGLELTDVYVVYDSKQIKLADGTNTTFDGSNPDIRFDGGGELEDKNYINTIRNCLIAQNYSDSAKQIEKYDYELHYKQINKIWSNNRLSIFQMKDLLYEEKNKFIERAISSAKKTNIKIIIGLDERGYEVIYFEFPFGQVSFHLMIDEDKLDVLLKKHKNIIYDENYKWSGFTNSWSLLMNEWKKIQPNENNFKTGGLSELLAPNGKPSKLTPEQYKLVRLPEFKAWFGDWENSPETSSKVFDSNGEPLVCYHGTKYTNEYYNFDLETIDESKVKAFFFSSGYAHAKRYTYNVGYIREFFINIRKLFDPKNLSKQEVKSILSILNEKLVVELNNYNEDDSFFDELKKEYGIYDMPTNIALFHILTKTTSSWQIIEQPSFQNYLIEKRYEGFKTSEQSTLIKKDNENFSVYSPKNIKLADGTNTTFDGSNPDIRFAGGGETDLDNINLTTYIVRFDTDEDSEIELVTTDFEDAKYRYDSTTKGDYTNGSFSVGLDKKVDTYKFVYELDEDESIEDYPIEEYYKNLNFYELIDEGEFEIIENRVVESYNYTSNDLLNDVENWAKNKFGNYKYNRIDVYSEDDENEENEPIGSIQLRISDHSQNEDNLPYGIDESLSVVIANKDATRGRFQQNKLQIYFSGDDSFEYVLSRIEEHLQESKENIMQNKSDNFAKGGKVNIIPADVQKYKKIGIEDKYIIEAINDIGLQNTKFDSDSINKTIENNFNELLKKSNDYIISEDSTAITNVILNEIEEKKKAGATDEYLEEYELKLTNPQDRKEYINEFAETQKETIDEWVSYLKQSDYPVALKFLILKAVLTYNYDYKINDFRKRGNETIRNFTPFDAGSLSQLVSKNSTNLLEDYTNIQIENAVNIAKSKEFVKTSTGGSWLKFNGGSKTSEEEILNNSKELSQLVQNTYWCTKTNSKSQLDGGDFYVYVTKTNEKVFPRIAIRMEEDKVGEVRGNKSASQDIEEEMLPVAKEFLTKNIANNSGQKWLDSIDYNEQAIALNLKIENKGLFKNSVEEFIELKSKEKQNLLDYADRNGHIVRIEKLIEGLLPNLPNEFYGEKEVVIDLEEFANKKTKIIIGDADFEYSRIKNLGQLTTIGGSAYFTDSKIKSLGQLTTIGYRADFVNSQITDLGQLTTIGGDAYFQGSQVTDLRQLTTIGGYADFRYSQITDLRQLTTIGGSAYFTDSQITDLGQLTTIGGDAYFQGSQVTDLGQLTTIGGYANFTDSQIIGLGQLTTIGRTAYFNNSKVTDLGQLTTIDGGAYFKDSQITDLGQLTMIGGYANFKYSKITDLGQLTTIGSDTDFEGSQFTYLGNLQSIGGNAYFQDSQVTDLGQLTTIGGNAIFRDSQVKDLGQLTTIGRSAYFKGSQITGLGKLIMIGGDAFFDNSQVTDLGKLTTIGGDAYFNGSQITDLSQLTTIGGDAYFGNKINLENQWKEIKKSNKFSKGGKVNIIPADVQKYKKIGIEDKYIIEAINDIGLQNTKFDADSINKTIENNFNELLKKSNDYIISEDSTAITNVILNEIEEKKKAGATDEYLEEYELKLTNPKDRKGYINKFATTQKETIDEWVSYLKKSDYPVALKFLILKAVLTYNYDYKINDFRKRGNETIRNFTPFDAGSLSQLVSKNSTNLLEDYTNIQIENAVNIAKSKEFLKTSTGGSWLKFNGGSKTSEEERLKNSKELAQLVQNTYWCTKTNSKSQLDRGDFYVYVTKTNEEVFPRIAIRMNEDKVGEVRGNASSSQDIEVEMLPIAKEFLTKNIANNSGEKWLDSIYYNEQAIALNLKIESKGLFKNSVQEFIELKSKEKQNLLDYADRNGHIVRIEKLIEGLLPTLPNKFYGEKEVVIDLEKFDNKKTKIIIGDAYFEDSQITDLGQLTTIGGLANFYVSEFTDLGKLTTIGGDAYFYGSQFTDLGQLTTIGGVAEFGNSEIKDLGQLTTIGGTADFRYSKITDLGQLTTIGGDAYLRGSQITDLGKLIMIGGFANFTNSQFTDLGQLTTIGRDAYFEGSQIKSLGQLTMIGGGANFTNSQVKDLGQLTMIGGDANFYESQITDLGQLITIVGGAYFDNSQVKDLGELTTIGGGAYFDNSQITDLGQLTTIGGVAIFRDSQVKDLGQLTTIGRDADFRYSQIKSLGELTTIGGNAYFTDSQIIGLGQLTTIGGNRYFGNNINLENQWKERQKSNKFSKGGKVNIIPADVQKYKKIGIEDKYIIEAINDIGLQNTKFDSDSINKTIENNFNELLKKSNDYIISEDSTAITNVILNEIEEKKKAGATDEYLEEYELKLTNPQDRKEYINEFATTQKETIDEWTSYLKQSDYPVALKFLILKAVLTYNYDYKINDFRKRGNETIRNFTPFDAGSLSQLVAKKSINLLEDYTNIQIENAVNIAKSKEFLKTSTGGSWLKFNGGSNTSEEEILKNSKELSQLVQNTYWCTKTNSKSQLDGGDFYVYVTKTNEEVFPRLAIRMEEDKVGEVRGNASSSQDIEVEMFPIAKEFLTKNIANGSGKKWLDGIKYNQEAIKFYDKIYENGLFKNSVEEFIKLKSKEIENLLDYADRNGHIVRIEKLIEGLLPTLPNQFYGEKEVVINLSDFDNKKTKIIIGDAYFQYSKITDLSQLTTIGGFADFRYSQVTDLSQLTTINGYANFNDSKVTDLRQLTTIGGNGIFGNSQVTDLGQLTTIGGGAFFTDSQVTDLGQLTTIGGGAYFENSKVTDLGQLTTIGGGADFKDSKIKSLGQLTTIGGNAYFQNSQVTDLGQLTTIGGNGIFQNSQVTDLGQLTTIGGTAYFENSQVTDLGQLTTIGRNPYFKNSQVTDLSQLTTIGGDADFNGSQVKDLGQLTTIGGTAYFKGSQITDLGKLITIGGNADFTSSQVKDLGQLTTIGGSAYFKGSQITGLGKLIMIGGFANFTNSQVTDLGQLTTIGEYALWGDNVNLENQWKERQKSNKFSKGGKVNMNYLSEKSKDKYDEIQKKIIDLSEQGKSDTLEYFKLIKELSILEQSKLKNTNNKHNMNKNNFAKGGKIVGKILSKDGVNEFVHEQAQKYGRIGVTDFYFIEASQDVGYQGINFDEKSLLNKIKIEFEKLLDTYTNYIISKDSPAITNYILNRIDALTGQGASVEVLQSEKEKIENEEARNKIVSETAETQKESLELWINYFRQDEQYSIPFKFLLLKALLNFNYDLKLNKLFQRDDATVRNFTPFDAGSLAELYESRGTFLLVDYTKIMNENAFKIFNSKEVVSENKDGKWIKFNGGKKMKPDDIQKNSRDLTQLVQNTYWCTKNRATIQLQGGDFYVYVTETNGEVFPRIAVRMDENKVGEVRGNASSSQDIEADMLPIAQEFLMKNIPNNSGTKWLNSIRYNTKCADITKRIESEGFYEGFIYDYIQIWADRDKYKVDYGANGNVTKMKQVFDIEKEKLPNQFYRRGDIEDNLNLLNKRTKYFIGDIGSYEMSKLNSLNMKFDDLREWDLNVISGNLYCGTELSNFGNLEYIGGDLYGFSRITTSLNNIKYIGGNLELGQTSQIESLGNLEYLGTKIVIDGNLKSLGKLKKVSSIEINNCDESFTLGDLEEIENDLKINFKERNFSFGKLKKINGSLYANKTILTSLGQLEFVGGDFDISGSKIKEFGSLKFIGGSADFSNNFTSNTQSIDTIMGDIKLLNSRIMEITNLKKIGGTIEFRGSFIKSLGNLKTLGGNLNLVESKIEDLGNLEMIGGFASFKGSKVVSLNKLKKITSFANFEGSEVEDLGDLEIIGGNAYFNFSKIKSIDKLNFIGGLIMMGKNSLQGLEGHYEELKQFLSK